MIYSHHGLACIVQIANAKDIYQTARNSTIFIGAAMFLHQELSGKQHRNILNFSPWEIYQELRDIVVREMQKTGRIYDEHELPLPLLHGRPIADQQAVIDELRIWAVKRCHHWWSKCEVDAKACFQLQLGTKYDDLTQHKKNMLEKTSKLYKLHELVMLAASQFTNWRQWAIYNDLQQRDMPESTSTDTLPMGEESFVESQPMGEEETAPGYLTDIEEETAGFQGEIQDVASAAAAGTGEATAEDMDSQPLPALESDSLLDMDSQPLGADTFTSEPSAKRLRTYSSQSQGVIDLET